MDEIKSSIYAKHIPLSDIHKQDFKFNNQLNCNHIIAYDESYSESGVFRKDSYDDVVYENDRFTLCKYCPDCGVKL